MKTRLWNEMLMVAVALLALNGVARAQSTDNDGCSNATLRGDYAFTVHGEFLGLVTDTGPQYFSSPVPIDGVAITNFDGKGTFTRVHFNVLNGVVSPGSPTDPVTGFSINDSGTYTVVLTLDDTSELTPSLSIWFDATAHTPEAAFTSREVLIGSLQDALTHERIVSFLEEGSGVSLRSSMR